MIFTIDIGNTSVSLGGLTALPEGGYEVAFCGKIHTVPSWKTLDYLQEIRHLLKQKGVTPGQFRGAVLSSVVPCLIPPIQNCVRMLMGQEAILLHADSDTGLTLQVPDPDSVGLDRLVDSAWAADQFPLPAVTVDLGTASTFNVIDVGRVFLGGIIAPGLDTSLKALSDRAAQLPKIQLETPDHVIGQNTKECMLAGAVAGTAAMVDGLVSRIEAELGQPATLILTGGLARYVHPLCTHPHTYDPHLLAKGLALLYERNAPVRAAAQ